VWEIEREREMVIEMNGGVYIVGGGGGKR